jgi:prokaryotic ubiquitin-like protein Pup
MPEQERKQVQKKGGGDDSTDADAGQVSAASKASELKEEMDEILDEIDSVLEENAEEFVKSYVQKGGE